MASGDKKLLVLVCITDRGYIIVWDMFLQVAVSIFTMCACMSRCINVDEAK